MLLCILTMKKHIISEIERKKESTLYSYLLEAKLVYETNPDYKYGRIHVIQNEMKTKAVGFLKIYDHDLNACRRLLLFYEMIL